MDIAHIFFANHESHWGLCKHKAYLSQYLPFGGVPPVRTRPEHHMVGDCWLYISITSAFYPHMMVGFRFPPFFQWIKGKFSPETHGFLSSNMTGFPWVSGFSFPIIQFYELFIDIWLDHKWNKWMIHFITYVTLKSINPISIIFPSSTIFHGFSMGFPWVFHVFSTIFVDEFHHLGKGFNRQEAPVVWEGRGEQSSPLNQKESPVQPKVPLRWLTLW